MSQISHKAVQIYKPFPIDHDDPDQLHLPLRHISILYYKAHIVVFKFWINSSERLMFNAVLCQILTANIICASALMGILPDTQIAGAHAPGMPGTFSPSPQVSDPDMHHGTCVTHVPWCMPGSLTSGFLWNRRRGKTFPAFPAHAQPAILRIW